MAYGNLGALLTAKTAARDWESATYHFRYVEILYYLFLAVRRAPYFVAIDFVVTASNGKLDHESSAPSFQVLTPRSGATGGRDLLIHYLDALFQIAMFGSQSNRPTHQ